MLLIQNYFCVNKLISICKINSAEFYLNKCQLDDKYIIMHDREHIFFAAVRNNRL